MSAKFREEINREAPEVKGLGITFCPEQGWDRAQFGVRAASWAPGLGQGQGQGRGPRKAGT
jgi:hypothetical protein